MSEAELFWQITVYKQILYLYLTELFKLELVTKLKSLK